MVEDSGSWIWNDEMIVGLASEMGPQFEPVSSAELLSLYECEV
jgi:hypothetical protein